MFEIYLITNQINEKIYVGQTIYDKEARWKLHLRDFSRNKDMMLYRAFAKYGVQRFTLDHLAHAKTLEELDDLETFWIAKLKANDRKIGYNMTAGGRGFKGLSEESKEKHRLAHLGKRPNRYRHDLAADEVADLYLSGKSSLEIARMLKTTKTTILRRLQLAGVEMRGPKDCTPLEKTPRYRSDISAEEMASLFKQGMSHQKIASKLGVTFGCVVWRLRKLGMFRSQNCNLNENEIATMYESGISGINIAAKFGVSPASVYNLLKKLEIPRRKSSVRSK